MSKSNQKREKKEKKPGKLYRFARWLLGGIIRCMYRVHIHGAENLPEGGAIICANHTGYPDSLVLAATLPRQVHFLAKKELFRIPILGGLIRAFGAVPIKRDSADVGAIKEIVNISMSGRLVAVFPQGHRRYGLNPADTEIKHGVGMMAYRSDMPVVPICIKMKKQKYALFRRVDVIIGEPMLYRDICTEHSGADYKIASQAFFTQVCLLGGYTPSCLTEGEQK